MAKRTGPTNAYLRKLIGQLKSGEAPIWKAVADKLSNPTRQRVEVNLSDISRNAGDASIVVIPGVVLGTGELKKGLTVASWKFSSAATEKIKAANGKTMTIEELVQENPKGTGVKVLA
ncbi:50S ribosomal protein L18e [archaeon]|nr:MAG: 50S ribosomal protein L18e [archaeon]